MPKKNRPFKTFPWTIVLPPCSRLKIRNSKLETLSQSRHAQLLPGYFAGKDIAALALFDHHFPIHHHRPHPRRMTAHFCRVDFFRQLLADQIVEFIRIEDRSEEHTSELQSQIHL